ncbi:hypothetical protein FA15DRAFT_694978 [Coprinopsis marcescibilis]|uniref:Uncharacterized protein n=1 Tax=Coprinopsis marcescibilis TaxID=230819 RepID=A0A5C3KTM7_COPMA|nr:hypothetical protein FA15DRAFT_694978 [Coprinopsis marcescibilis]
MRVRSAKDHSTSKRCSASRMDLTVGTTTPKAKGNAQDQNQQRDKEREENRRPLADEINKKRGHGTGKQDPPDFLTCFGTTEARCSQHFKRIRASASRCSDLVKRVSDEESATTDEKVSSPQYDEPFSDLTAHHNRQEAPLFTLTLKALRKDIRDYNKDRIGRLTMAHCRGHFLAFNERGNEERASNSARPRISRKPHIRTNRGTSKRRPRTQRPADGGWDAMTNPRRCNLNQGTRKSGTQELRRPVDGKTGGRDLTPQNTSVRTGDLRNQNIRHSQRWRSAQRVHTHLLTQSGRRVEHGRAGKTSATVGAGGSRRIKNTQRCRTKGSVQTPAILIGACHTSCCALNMVRSCGPRRRGNHESRAPGCKGGRGGGTWQTEEGCCISENAPAQNTQRWRTKEPVRHFEHLDRHMGTLLVALT